MAESPTSSPVSQKDDDLAIIVGAALQIEYARDGFVSLRALLPEVRDGDLNGVLAALDTAGKLGAFRALLVDPVRWKDIKTEFLAQLSHAAANDPWIVSFVEGYARIGSDASARKTEVLGRTASAESRADAALERAKDIEAFDALIAKSPDILSRLKAQWIDLDAEKTRERERVRAENPGASDGEIGARAAITVYLRHQDAIRSAAPDAALQQELTAGFEQLQKHARDAGVPYQEPIRYAKGILPLDKTAMLAVTTGASQDTWATRSGNTLSIASRTDGFVQVWTLNPGERPEKSVGLPNWPRIRIASVPEHDTALFDRKRRAIDRVAEITGWDWVRTPEGLDAARSRFPKSLEASVSDAESAPAAWRAFVLAYGAADEEQGEILAVAMGERTARITDPGLRQKMAEGLDALVGSKRELGDHSAELMSEIGARNLAAIEAESSDAKARAEKKRDGFERAVRTVAEASAEEDRNIGGFRQEVVHAEEIARDNLAYFRDNGFLALGPHFDEFLAAVNRNQVAINPSADGQFSLPKVLSENDRALLARGLVRAMGEAENVADWFEVPGYQLKFADSEGEITTTRIRLNLEKSGVLKDGQLRSEALDLRLGTGSPV